MKTGTAQLILDGDELTATGSSLLNVISSSGGPGGSEGGDPDGGDFPHQPNRGTEQTAPAIDKSKYIAWFLLLAVGMTFAGLLGAYLMIATNRAAEWKPFDLPIQIWISTIIILASSVTYSIAKRYLEDDNSNAARTWLIVTTVLGAVFISSQLIVWLELIDRGFYMQGNPYAGFFYILTAAHLVHVAGGIIALGSVLLRCWYPAAGEVDRTRRTDLGRSVGWYWHFMGFLWVVLFLMLGLWK